MSMDEQPNTSAELLQEVIMLRAKLEAAERKAQRRATYITECQQIIGTHDNLKVAINILLHEVETLRFEKLDEQVKLAAAEQRESRLREVLVQAKHFISYARYQLEKEHEQFEQFPCQSCADRYLQRIDAALTAAPQQPAAEREVMQKTADRVGTWPAWKVGEVSQRAAQPATPEPKPADDAELLDWMLLDIQPDVIGDVDIWQSIPFFADENNPDAEYLKAARQAIRAAIAQQKEQGGAA